MEQIVIKKKVSNKKNIIWKPLMVPAEIYDQLQALSEDTGISKGYLAINLLDFALKRTVVQEEEK